MSFAHLLIQISGQEPQKRLSCTFPQFRSAPCYWLVAGSESGAQIPQKPKPPTA